MGQREARAQSSVASRGRSQSGRMPANVGIMADPRIHALSRCADRTANLVQPKSPEHRTLSGRSGSSAMLRTAAEGVVEWRVTGARRSSVLAGTVDTPVRGRTRATR